MPSGQGGAPLEVNLSALLRRRLIDAQRGVDNGLPMWSSYGAGFEDLLAFWHREVDEQRLTDLIHALALVDTGQWSGKLHRKPSGAVMSLRQIYRRVAVWFDADGEAQTRLQPIEWPAANCSLRMNFKPHSSCRRSITC